MQQQLDNNKTGICVDNNTPDENMEEASTQKKQKPIFRFNLSDEMVDALLDFSKMHQFDDRHAYADADNVEGGGDANDTGADEEMTSVSEMLAEFEAMRALTATTAVVSVVVEDTVKVEQSEEVELVMTATAVKEEQKQQEQEKEKETKKETKGKWFSWF